MTARWSGAGRGRKVATPRSEDDLEVEHGGFSHGARRAVSKGGVHHGCS